MSQIVNGNDSAFGYGVPGDEKAGWLPESIPGLTKREMFAAMAMTNFHQMSYTGWLDEEIAKRSVSLADALIAELSK